LVQLMADAKPLIIDNGTGTIKAGLAGADAPSLIIPSLVGRPNDPAAGLEATYVGKDALEKSTELTIKYPIERGVITGWDDMEALWAAVFERLNLVPSETSVLLTEHAGNPKENREKLTQLMFEKFQVPRMYLAHKGVLAVYASGRTTGVVLTAGDGNIDAVPVYEGYALPHAVVKLPMGGRDLTDYLIHLLEQRGYTFTTLAERGTAQDIKEQLGYVAEDFDAELQKAAASAELEKNFQRPDGAVITLGSERFRAAEAMFKPAQIGLESEGIHVAIYSAIMKCDVGLRKDLFSNIVLAGGCTGFGGLGARLTRELTALAPPAMRLNVVAPGERGVSAWIGGSILSSLATFQSMWITKEEYSASGPTIVHTKCF
jgi:actin, other eukaryote